MKKLLVVALAVVLTLSLVIGSSAVMAVKPGTNDDYNGNGAPSGKHYNLNIIGVPGEKNENFDGGNGSRIFVLREGRTWFYVQGGDSYAILDHDGTDGMVGGGKGDAGIIFPYSGIPGEGGEWKVQIYVRLVGPNDPNNKADWASYTPEDYGLNKGTVVDPNGATWWEYDSFTLGKSSKFAVKTAKLLCDDFDEMLWTLDPGTKFRICQMRIYLEEM